MTKLVTGHHRWKLVHCKKRKTKENAGKRFAFQRFEMDTVREKETSLTFVSRFGVNFRHDLAVAKKSFSEGGEKRFKGKMKRVLSIEFSSWSSW